MRRSYINKKRKEAFMTIRKVTKVSATTCKCKSSC